MMKKYVFGLLLAGTASQPALAHEFMPENDLHLQDQVNFTAGITQDEFEAVIDQFEEIYTPIVKAAGGKLKVNRRWSDSTVNASASQSFGTWNVNMYGGLARRPEVTKDGFALVLCHELGHHLAGFPRSSGWAANEGQSDYFATLACGRLAWSDEKDINATFRDEIPAFPKKLCDEKWSTEDEQNLCYRSMMAGYSLGKLLGTLGGTPNVDFDTPDTDEVRRTDNAHPAGQCRLDTYMAGALCTMTFDENVIPKTEAESFRYACATSDTMAARPRCWFKPTM